MTEAAPDTPSNHERLKAAYRLARSQGLWPTTRANKLTEPGRQQAYWFIQGWKFSANEAQDTTMFLCQVRGPDFAMGLEDNGQEREA